MSDVANILSHLQRRFADHRVVFWYDLEGQYAADLDALNLPGVSAIRVANNEYGIKKRLLHDQPESKFLVYRSGPASAGIGNWLLDLELAYGIFTADRSALVAQDLGLDSHDGDEIVKEHEKFFASDKRIESLKALLTPEDDATRLLAKMSAVVLGQKEHSLLEITRALLAENAKGQHTKYAALAEYGLDDFYWRGVFSIYRYESSSPTVDDLILWIFRLALVGFQSDRAGGLQNVQLDFASLRNDRRSHDALAVLARRASNDLNYEASIEDVGFRDLVSVDVFEETDRKIIADLARGVTEQTVTAREVAEVVRMRKSSIWFDSYKELYGAIAAAAELLSALNAIDFTFSTADEALERYCGAWFHIDQLYRQFTYAWRTYEGPHPLNPLREQVEKRYTNKFVYELGNAWQKQVDETDHWGSTALRPQRSFYTDVVAPLVDGGKKAVVIISDALRYEIADELGSRIRQEDRFDADLQAVLGVLPSYTQLGMAALLPHQTLKFSADGKFVLADDQPTSGTVARAAILESVGGTAVRAEQFRVMAPSDRRDLFKANQVLYIYHNTIDKTGDDHLSERGVFEAAETALREIVDLVKKAANANATNMFVTADHGFLFQDEALPEQFFLSERPHGDSILVTNRRYVLGRALKNDPAFTTFTSAQLDLNDDIEIQIPKSIYRLKVPGGGSRFVHGGATLQEVVVPVLSINKKRKSDTRGVAVTVLPKTDKITTSQLVVKVFQSEPVSDKVQARTLRAGLYVGETLISNDPPPELTFDSSSSEQRDRYQSIQLLLNKDANNYNNRPVELRLEERIPNTNQWRVYEKAIYTLKRSFTTDFDF
ncbi:BREX-1 system phosphatase PglZ type A [Gordonia sp. SND2]|uniref:BREX-1 system phosphatase PglZ type A n=1 Tax=Gordonia sp. SND2 TaxID=3388659 RepID=UPI00398B09F5